MTRIDNSYLLGLWGLNTAGVSTGSAAASSAVKKQPTAPWASSVADKQPTQSELLRKAMSNGRFIDESANRVDLRTKTTSEYKTLFALHTGLQMLEALSLRSLEKNVPSSELARLQKRFDAGLQEVNDYLLKAGGDIDTVRLINGVSSTRAQSTTKVARDNHVYNTGPIHSGSLSDPVRNFEGDVRFGISVSTLTNTQTINIDLAEMGDTPRTMDAVIGHINEKLSQAGVQTRFTRQDIKAEPRTMKVGDRTITLPSVTDSWGMTVTANTVEKVGFSAPSTGTAVQLVQKAGSTSQTLKFDPNSTGQMGIGETNWVEGRTYQNKLPDGISDIRASVATDDGGMWIVADTVSASGGHTLRGQSDVVLMKLDSAGQVVVSQGLGASTMASGYSIALSSDGRVAVAGSVIGGMVPGQKVADPNLSDSFVTVFDANGVEQWTQSRGARAADEATGVAFGDDGRIYVTGRAQSAMSGTSAIGGWDGYVQAFGETQAHSAAPKVGVPMGVQQFGTAGDDNVQAMTVDGNNLYTAGIESGTFVVRQFRIGGDGAPELLSTRNLGTAFNGEVANISVANGKVIVSGTTRNAALNAGTVTRAHAGGTDVFVASLSTDLNASANDRVAYYGSAGEDSAADIKVLNGEVWMTGTWDGKLLPKDTDSVTAYLARMDLDTGAVDWNRTWGADKTKTTPQTLSVSANGSSVLDRLGLPQGELVQDVSQKLVESTGLKVGDRFFVTNPLSNRKTTITIEARDTLQTLATKIENASGRNLKVTVSTDRSEVSSKEGDSRVLAGGSQYLSITNAEGRNGALLSAGEVGRDALAALGLSSGFVGKSDSKRKTVGLDLPDSLSLFNTAASNKSKDYVQSALRAVREAYRAMNPTTLAASTTNKGATGQPSAYMQSQIANYQAALSRLTG